MARYQTGVRSTGASLARKEGKNRTRRLTDAGRSEKQALPRATTGGGGGGGARPRKVGQPVPSRPRLALADIGDARGGPLVAGVVIGKTQ